jgi:protocatechuate 4,5-dioxygenase alpha subunit
MQQPRKEYEDIPGTTVFDADQCRKGYGINMFCMSLLKAPNREAFKQDEAGYLKQYNLTPGQTEAVLKRSPDVDFLYYSNDMIGAGGLLYCLAQGIDVPGKVGLAGFNGVELLDGLPRKLATMDACRLEIGRRAAEIIAGKHEGTIGGEVIELFPTLQPGDTIRG